MPGEGKKRPSVTRPSSTPPKKILFRIRFSLLGGKGKKKEKKLDGLEIGERGKKGVRDMRVGVGEKKPLSCHSTLQCPRKIPFLDRFFSFFRGRPSHPIPSPLSTNPFPPSPSSGVSEPEGRVKRKEI